MIDVRNWFCGAPLRDGRNFHRATERFASVCLLPCGGELVFVKEDPSLAVELRSACCDKYNPSLDIGRYVVLCPIRDKHVRECPWWEAFREVFARRHVQTAHIAPGAVGIGQDVRDADAHAPWIGYRDGAAGPVAVRFGFELEMPKDIVQVAEECRRAAEPAERAADVVQGVHGGWIIAFIRRLIRRGGKRK